MLGDIILRYITLCIHCVLGYVTLGYVRLGYVMLHYVALCCITSHYGNLHNATLCYVMLD